MKKTWVNNWGLKLIAVILATLIWLLIMNNSDPVTTFTVSGIPVEFINEDTLSENDMVYQVVGSKTISVSVTTRTNDKKKIDKEDFKATADLNNIYNVTSNVEVKVELVGDDADLVRSWQQIDYNVRVVTEDIITKDFAIEVVQEGEVESGYNYRQCYLSSDTVALTAPVSELNDISAVKAIVDVSQSAKSETMTVPLRFYNASGKEIKSLSELGIEAEMLKVDVDVMVQKTSPVSIDVVVNNKDKVAEGYRYITYRISAQSISVIGTMQSVAGLDKIQIEVDAEGAAGEVTEQVDIMDYLPENVTVAGDNTTVTIRLVVEPEGSIDFEVSSRNISFDGAYGNLQYLIHQPTMTVNVFGLKSDWENLTADDIYLVADVNGKGVGDYIVTLTPVEIEGLEITVQGEANLTVKQPPEEDESEDDTSEDSTTANRDGASAGTDESEDKTSAEDSVQVGGTVSGKAGESTAAGSETQNSRETKGSSETKSSSSGNR